MDQEAGHLKPKYRKFRRQIEYVMQRASHGWCDFLNLPHSFDKSFRRNRTFRNVLLEILYDRQTLARGYFSRGGVDKLVQYELSGHDVGHIFKSILSVEMMHRTFGE